MLELGGGLRPASQLKAAPAEGVGQHTGPLAAGERQSNHQRCGRWERVGERRVQCPQPQE